MAVKIITEGRLPENVLIQKICQNCDSLLEFSRSDGEYIPDQRDGDSVKITCPFCSKKIYVSSKEFI